MTGRKADIIHRLYELQEKMEEVDGYWEDALERDALMEVRDTRNYIRPYIRNIGTS